MSLHPDLQKLVASSTMINSNRYTPFFIETSTGDTRWSLRPIGDGADIPEVVVNEQKHTVTVPDYGVNLKVTYKALRHRSTAQFKVLLWFLGYRLQADKNGLLIDTVINGDGNANPAIVHNTAVSGSLDYTDLVNFYSEFYPFEMKLFLVHKDMLATLLTMEVFKDPLAGFTFQRTGEIVSPLGSKLVRCDEIPPDMIIGMDNRFAMEEVVGQPLSVEYDKIIEQRIEEAVISESVAFTKIVHEAARILDTEWGEVK
ncbi:MAG: hypothetical protein GF315_07065 [candidate division Zixibacteria bacterium]|nr:hypothetical protein [candidate division Zixibacteria bacterium]